MIPLTVNESKSDHNPKVFYYTEKDLVLMMKTKNIIKSETTVIVLENIEELSNIQI